MPSFFLFSNSCDRFIEVMKVLKAKKYGKMKQRQQQSAAEKASAAVAEVESSDMEAINNEKVGENSTIFSTPTRRLMFSLFKFYFREYLFNHVCTRVSSPRRSVSVPPSPSLISIVNSLDGFPPDFPFESPQCKAELF